MLIYLPRLRRLIFFCLVLLVPGCKINELLVTLPPLLIWALKSLVDELRLFLALLDEYLLVPITDPLVGKEPKWACPKWVGLFLGGGGGGELELSRVDLEDDDVEPLRIFRCFSTFVRFFNTITPRANFCSFDNLGGGGGDLK